MSAVNTFTREVALKVVYYGPGLGGKTSSLQHIHRVLKPESRGDLVSLATGADRTLYFDFLPVKLPKLGGFTVRLQLYTVPGQVHYNSTRKLVLSGADGVVFVADSQEQRFDANVESLENLHENLREQGRKLEDLPLVFQWNKRDMEHAVPLEQLEARLNSSGMPSFETVATNGKGTMEALQAITGATLKDLRRRNILKGDGPADEDQLEVVAETETEEEADDPADRPTPPPPPRPTDVAKTLPPPASISDMPMVMGRISDMVDVIDAAGAYAMNTASTAPQPPERSLSELVYAAEPRRAIIEIERRIDQGKWSLAVVRAGTTFRTLASRLATSFPGTHEAEAPALAALRTQISPRRLMRFREIQARALADGAVSQNDALFALLFLVDFAMRAEET